MQGKLASPAILGSAFFTSLLERSVDVLLITGPSGRCQYLNPGAMALLGQARPQGQGDNLLAWLHGQDRSLMEQVMQQAQHQPKTACPPFRLPTADQQWVWLSGQIIHMGADAGTPVLNWLLNQVPPPAPKPTRSQQEQSRELQQLTNVLSHQLQAPMANALGLVNLLAGRPAEELFLEIINRLEITARSLDSGIKDINLLLAMRDNRHTLVLEELAFDKVFAQVSQHVRVALQGCRGQICLEVAEGYTLRSHQSYLFSILYNLIAHAIKYRSPQRPLQIRLSCAARPEGGTVICFSDNGQGLDPPEAGKSLFQLDKRAAPGLAGLYLVKTHIETLGGQLEVLSSPEEGTRILIHLPS